MSKDSTLSPLYALLLIGGKSTRMGMDKSLLEYHGKAQWQHNIELFDGLVEKVFISTRKNQKVDYPLTLEDRYEDLGPFGAILTAMENYPDKAFLVFATDIPYLNRNNLEFLISKRHPNFSATAFKGMHKDYPEPLACIWEPKLIKKLHEYYAEQNYKLIEILEQSDTQLIDIEDDLIQNINTFEEYLNCKKRSN